GVVALVDRHAVLARPAPVAVRDDRDVARGGQRGVGGLRKRLAGRSQIGGRRRMLGGPHHTSRISFSLALSTSSRSPTRLSVSFCSSTSARCSSSEDASPSALSSRR